MFTKILVLSLSMAIASGSNNHYPHKSHKEYRHSYEHRIPVHEPSSDEYKPESQGHAYSSQNVLHQGHSLAYEESHGAAEHEVPLYQYQVAEQSEEASPHNAPQQKYRPHYPQHDIQNVRVQAHKPAYLPEPHAVHKVPVYHSDSHDYSIPHYQSENHEAQYQKVHFQPESHEAPAYHTISHAPVQSHDAPAHHAISHAPVQSHDAPAHHAISHAPVQSHDAPAHHAISHAPAHSEPHAHDEPIDYYAYPKYQYEYKVEDPHTGDNKFQHEIRDGDVVKGIYGLQDADGSFRTVEYSSDKHHGFSAVVKHSAPGQHVHIESHHSNEHEQGN